MILEDSFNFTPIESNSNLKIDNLEGNKKDVQKTRRILQDGNDYLNSKKVYKK